MKAITLALAAAALLAACGEKPVDRLPGYVEADPVRVAAPFSGRLVSLAVSKGAEVKAGAALFALDQDSERAALDESRARVTQSEAQGDDLAKGKRQDEIAAIAAQRDAASAALHLAQNDLARQQDLARAGFLSGANLDALRERVNTAQAQLNEAEAQLRVARLAARDDARKAAAAGTAAARAQLAQTAWKLEQKTVSAPLAARVDDTLYRLGEWVPAGSPVVNLLAPEAIKLRFFVPQAALSRVRPGAQVRYGCDGCGAPRNATISFVADSAEFTPPVIYSRDSRAKLVFMVEAVPQPGNALRPGQPVDVMLEPAS